MLIFLENSQIFDLQLFTSPWNAKQSRESGYLFTMSSENVFYIFSSSSKKYLTVCIIPKAIYDKVVNVENKI